MTHSNYKVIRATLLTRQWVRNRRAMKKDVSIGHIDEYINRHWADFNEEEREYVLTFCDPKPTPLFIG